MASIFLAAPVANAMLTLSSNSIFFGAQPVGSFGVTQTVYVTNDGQKQVTLNVFGGCPSEFEITNECYTLFPNESCPIQARFQPTHEGEDMCTVSISDTSGDSQSLNISGQGVN